MALKKYLITLWLFVTIWSVVSVYFFMAGFSMYSHDQLSSVFIAYMTAGIFYVIASIYFVYKMRDEEANFKRLYLHGVAATWLILMQFIMIMTNGSWQEDPFYLVFMAVAVLCATLVMPAVGLFIAGKIKNNKT